MALGRTAEQDCVPPSSRMLPGDIYRPLDDYMVSLPGFSHYPSVSTPSSVGKRSMSPIQEEGTTDDLEEATVQEVDLVHHDPFQEPPKEEKKQAKKLKKGKREQALDGRWFPPGA